MFDPVSGQCFQTPVLQAVRAKSPKAGRKSPQHLWRPPSPSNTSSPHNTHEREFSLRGGQQERTTASAQRTRSPQLLRTGRQQSPTAGAAAQHEQERWGSQLLDEQLGGGYTGGRVASPGTRSVSSREPPGGASPGTAMIELAAARVDAAGVGLLGETDHTEGPASRITAPAGKASAGQAGSGRAGRLGGALQIPGSGEQEAAVASDRITLTQPYVFRWGGRINSKHRPLCEMHSTAGPDSANRGSSRPKNVVNDSSQTAGSSQHSEVSKLPQKQQAAAQEQAAAAAALGARADKLMKLLELRVPRQHVNSGKRRPVSGRMQRLQHEAADGDELVYELEDDPIGCSDEYLRL